MFQWHKTYRFWAIFCKFSIVCFPHPNLRFGKSLVLSVLYAVNLKNWVWVAVPGRRLARMGSFSGKQQVKFFIQKRSNPTVVLWWIASCLDSLTEAVLVELWCELGLKWKSFKFEIIQTSLVAASCGFHVKGKNLQYVVLTPWPHCYPLLVCSQQYIYS